MNHLGKKENVGIWETWFTPSRRGQWNSHPGRQDGSATWDEVCNYPMTCDPTPGITPQEHSPRVIWGHLEKGCL